MCIATGSWRSSDQSRDVLTTMDTWFLDRANSNCSCFFNFAGDQKIFPSVVVSSVSYSCTACAKGQFREASSDVHSMCEACPAGQYQDTIGQSSCEPCPAGKFQPSLGATACEVCSFGNTSSGGASKCSECPVDKGVECASGFMTQKAGWWRARTATDATSAAVAGTLGDAMYLCFSEMNCPGSSGKGLATAVPNVTDQCSARRTGPVCALCAESFTMQSGTCLPCPRLNWKSIVTVLLVLVAAAPQALRGR